MIKLWRFLFSKWRLDFTSEYYERFMLPHIERAQSAGIDDDRIAGMVQQAIEGADFAARFPGTILRDLVDHELGRGDDDNA
jgi:hypothetical protein